MPQSMKRRVDYLFKAFLLSVAQFIAFVFRKILEKKNIWIFSEKKLEARDNGYHFFRYIRECHPEINAYYVIDKHGADIGKVVGLGPVLWYNSFRHCVYYYVAKERVCSQTHGVRPFEEYSALQRIKIYRRKDQRQINLKHGISKDFSSAFDFRKMGYDLYISGVKSEYDYIKANFNYPDKNIVLSGFCRFDALHNLPKPKEQILIMPTFRSWLRTSDSSKPEASPEEMQKFIDSDYYKFYSSLLSNTDLLSKVAGQGYSIIFYLHYTFQPYTKAFMHLASEVVTIAGRDCNDVQTLLKESSLLVTDYSSVFFDFAYMHKPVIYAQFDMAEYREKHYKEGMFIYERDGFGPVCGDLQSTVIEVEKELERNCLLDELYMKRVTDFFIPYDNHNCERVYNAILKLEE